MAAHGNQKTQSARRARKPWACGTTNEMPDFLIYGANGYTGSLIARAAVARGHRPVLAGRNVEALAALARELGLEYRTFPLDKPGAAADGIEGALAVLHCAGPFA